MLSEAGSYPLYVLAIIVCFKVGSILSWKKDWLPNYILPLRHNHWRSILRLCFLSLTSESSQPSQDQWTLSWSQRFAAFSQLMTFILVPIVLSLWNFCFFLLCLHFYSPVFAHFLHQQPQQCIQTIISTWCRAQAKWNGSASKMGLLAKGLCHLMTSQHVCWWMCKSWNLVKENQFRNVKVQTIMVVIVQKPKTIEAGTYDWVQVVICLSKGQFVTRKLETVILHLNSRPIPRELAIKQPFIMWIM